MSSTKDIITIEELESLTNVIKVKYGIDFTNYEKKSLQRGFARLIRKNNMDSVLDLWTKIMRDRDFLISNIDELLINLTEIFRNPDLWIFLRDTLLPSFPKEEKLKIWHAGCSTGEEAYTMAFVLKNLDRLKQTDILATDLSKSALTKAIKGDYSKILMTKYFRTFKASFSNAKLEDIFKINDKSISIIDDLKQNIHFKQHNLVSENINQKFDVIFCRNVMIYFDDPLKTKVLKLFFDSLNKGGYLIVGYYDMLPTATRSLFEVYNQSKRIYRKISEET